MKSFVLQGLLKKKTFAPNIKIPSPKGSKFSLEFDAISLT